MKGLRKTFIKIINLSLLSVYVENKFLRFRSQEIKIIQRKRDENNNNNTFKKKKHHLNCNHFQFVHPYLKCYSPNKYKLVPRLNCSVIHFYNKYNVFLAKKVNPTRFINIVFFW